MQLQVFKFEAAGNDFAAVDDRADALAEGAELEALARALCDRRRGIGGDGILVIKPSRTGADFRMIYHNADGSRGEMCGNGARSIARFAWQVGAAGETMAFETDAGPYRARLAGAGVTVSFPPVPGLPVRHSPQACGRTWDVDFLRVGVPHAVVWVEDLGSLDVEGCGRALRRHEVFAPAGSNINFACPDSTDAGLVRVRTYERGVEAETLACGTGSVATAMCRARRMGLGGAQSLRIIPTGGDTLEIGFRLTMDGAEEVTLSGPARHVFTTVVDWEHPPPGIRPAGTGL